ncbi:hypothetical protein JW930_05250 [Candidatus Woesearchaeota archaeon]|nr:hypothetical protein [Candidatus Woesearchaeota archaeon]
MDASGFMSESELETEVNNFFEQSPDVDALVAQYEIHEISSGERLQFDASSFLNVGMGIVVFLRDRSLVYFPDCGSLGWWKLAQFLSGIHSWGCYIGRGLDCIFTNITGEQESSQYVARLLEVHEALSQRIETPFSMRVSYSPITEGSNTEQIIQYWERLYLFYREGGMYIEEAKDLRGFSYGPAWLNAVERCYKLSKIRELTGLELEVNYDTKAGTVTVGVLNPDEIQYMNCCSIATGHLVSVPKPEEHGCQLTARSGEYIELISKLTPLVRIRVYPKIDSL